MKKISFLFASVLLTNISFAEDIYLVSNTNYCVLTPTETPGKTYLKSLNSVKKWSSYQGSKQVGTNLTLSNFGFNLDVCPDTILLNETDEEKYVGVDFLTNKTTPSHPYSILEVKEKIFLTILKKSHNNMHNNKVLIV